KITDPNGCTNTAVVNVTVSAMPQPFFMANTPVCEKGTLFLNSNGTTGAQYYSWSGPNGFISAVANPSISNISTLGTGLYSLSVSNGPCVAGTSGTVNV